MKFTRHHREYPVGGAFMPAAPIYRPMARRCAPQADKSAVRQYIVRLRSIPDGAW